MAEVDKVHGMLGEARGYDFVRFTISDIHGIPKVRVIPKRHLKQFIAEGPKMCQGVIYYAPTTLEYPGITCSFDNIAAMPVPGTFYPLPWAADGEYQVGEFLCEPCDIDTGVTLPATPRALARKQLATLSDKKLTLKSACEMEFLLLNKETKQAIFPKPNFATSSGVAALEKFMYSLDGYLFQAGVNVESLQDEAGAGQAELCIYPSEGIRAADQVFKFKQAAREIALQHDMYVTFMSMPSFPYGNGLHFNHSILDSDGNNAFYDEKQPDNLSQFARHWIAGLLKHAKALSALCAPTVNCFRRYHLPWAPDMVNWGMDDRFAAIRVKNNGPKGTYMENRLPSGSTNPYIVMAATVAAGLDGVEKEMDCPPPVKCEDATDRLPNTLKEALDELKADDALCAALGAEFIERFVEEKEKGEIALFENWSPDDKSDEAMEKERDLYMEFM